MATQSRRTDPSVKDLLLSESYRFDFFQAVRLLEGIYRDRHVIGGDAQPTEEIVRFRNHLSLSFPPSDIAGLEPRGEARHPADMTVAFMGLVGATGTLPRHYTELLLERAKAKDRTFLDFLDMISHRFVSFFYRAWEKHRVVVGYERAMVHGTYDDPVSRSLLALIGLAPPALQNNLGVEARSLVRFAGLLGKRPATAHSLETCLEGYVKAPVRITQFVGEWLTLEEEDWTSLSGNDRNNRLGMSAVAGTHVWDQQAGFQVRLGPLGYSDFASMLPSGVVFPRIVQVIRYYVGEALGFHIRLILKGADVPDCHLTETQAYVPQLGWNTWLAGRDQSESRDEVVFNGRHS